MAALIETFSGPYFICDAAGVIISFVILGLLSRKIKTGSGQLFGILICALAGLFIGCHVMNLIFALPQMVIDAADGTIASSAQFFERAGQALSGLAYFGGLFGSMLAVWTACRAFKQDVRLNMNILAVMFPLYQCAGRIGCSLAGCCYGMEYHGPLAIQYTQDYVIEGISDNIAAYPRFPLQPLEAFCGLVLFAVMLILFIRKKETLPLICIYVPSYALIRFLDEFLRDRDIMTMWGPLSPSQWIALAALIGAAVYWLRRGCQWGRI